MHCLGITRSLQCFLNSCGIWRAVYLCFTLSSWLWTCKCFSSWQINLWVIHFELSSINETTQTVFTQDKQNCRPVKCFKQSLHSNSAKTPHTVHSLGAEIWKLVSGNDYRVKSYWVKNEILHTVFNYIRDI